MPYYMIQATYTSEAWAAMVANPQSPMERLKPLVEGLGGTIESIFYAFGEHDIVVIWQGPDNVSAAAGALATAAGGAVKSIKTTVLLTVEEGLEAMKKAAGAVYRPPGA